MAQEFLPTSQSPQASGPDWQEIEKDYRGAQMSIAAICAKHDIARATLTVRASTSGWMRDLAPAVRMAAAERLLREDTRVGVENDAIDAAAIKLVAVALGHRKDIRNLREATEKMMGLVTRVIEGDVYLPKKHPDDPDTIDPRIAHLLGKSNLVDVYDKMATAYQRIVTMERAAFNMDGSATTPGISIETNLNKEGEQMVRVYIPDNGRGKDPVS